MEDHMLRVIAGCILLSLFTGFTHAVEEKEKRMTIPPTPWIAYKAAYGASVVADAISQQQAYNRGYTEHNPLYSSFGGDAARTTMRLALGGLTIWGLSKLHEKHPKAAIRTIVGLMLANFAIAIIHDKRCQPDDLGNRTCPPEHVSCPDNFSTCEL